MEIASETTPAARSPKGKGTRTSGTRSGTGRATQKDTYLTGGVSVSPMPITAGEEVTVKYNGLLAEAGADSMYLHAGFGQRGHGTVCSISRCRKRSQACGGQRFR